MSWVRTTVRNVQTAGELFGFFGKQKRWWLLPIIVSLFLLGALIVVAQSSSLAPFISPVLGACLRSGALQLSVLLGLNGQPVKKLTG